MEHIIYKLKKNNIKINVVNDQLKLEIPEGFDPKDILPEIRDHKQELIAFIKKIKDTDNGFGGIEPCGKKDFYTLSSVQKRLYFLYELDNTSMAYNLPQAVLLEGKLDKNKLKNVFNKLVERHESLRTSFVVVDNEPAQKISEHVDLNIEHYRSTKEKAPDLIKKFVRPFDLNNGPLIRVGLIEREDASGGEADQHILLVDMHHIISDGTSMGILVKDFMALYNDQELPALRLQYKDYAEWQQSEKRQKEIAKQKDFWANEFAEEVKPLNLPADYKRPLMRSNAGAYYGFNINAFEISEIKSIAEKEGTTLFIVLISLFKILLSKLSNQEDVVIGTPIAGRHHNDLEKMIGMFVPALPLRGYPKGDLTYRAFLSQLKTKIPVCFDNQSYEYEELLEELKIERNISYNPLFDFMFSLQNFEKNDLNIPGLTVKSLSNGHVAALFDITLVVTQNNENLGFGMNYSTELFKEETIKRFAGYFKKIISAIVTNRDIKLADIDIIPHDEKARILSEFNHSEVSRPQCTLVDLFEERVKLCPDNNAILFKGDALSYNDLNTQVNRLAQYLIGEKGIKTEDKVGIYFNRSPKMIIALLAIMKSGGTYISLDPDYPPERVNAIIENSGIKLVITNIGDDLQKVNSTIDFIDVEKAESLISEMPDKNPKVAISGKDAAYVIYTSGSTGTPKGVIIEHAAMLDYSITFKNYFGINENDKVIQQSSFSFDTCVEEIFPALIAGGEVIVMPEGGRDIPALVETIERTEASVISTTPIVLNILNDYADSLKSLRTIISGGDLLLPSHISKLFGKLTIYNTYGPSESTVCITYHKIEKLENTSCIGRPIENRQVYIMNQSGKLCPIGVPGELCVSGKGLARGYLGDERATRQKFIDNPVIPGKQMYRTGDLAKWLPDGTIEFLGRVDDQVKIRGIRIELKEIESHLLTHELIKEAVVITKGNEIDKHLVAYYVSAEPVEASGLRRFLEKSLPNHMIPAYFVHLEKIPLTANGSKLDKKALPAPEKEAMENYAAPTSDTEKKLVVIWSEILKIDAGNISVTRSFFEMGGHSLKAAFLINRLRKELAVDIPLREIFKNQDIRTLSKFIDNAGKTDYAAIEKAPDKDYYVLSAAQRRLYFLYEFDKASLAYNLPQVVKLEGELDKNRLNVAFTKLVNRHESLRTYFEVLGDEPMQKIASQSDFNITYHQSSEEQAPAIIKQFVRPFDLSQSPLIRVGVIEVSAKEHILMVDLHHIITDGLSQGILVQDFMSLYYGKDLPELKLQYKDYAEWQQSDQQQQEIAKQREFWLEEFSEPVTMLDLPVDFNRKDISNHEGASFGFALNTAESRLLKAMAEKEGTTMFMVLLSVFNILLSKLTDQEDIVVGTTVAGREHNDLEGMIGMFVNTLPLRNYPKGDLSYRKFLAELKSKTLSSFDNQAYPYEELVDELKVARDTSRNPLFDAVFGFQNFEGKGGFNMPGLKLKPYNIEHSASKFDLTLMAAESGDQIYLEFDYSTQLFKKDTIERFAAYIRRIISEIAQNTDVTLSAINILSEDEQYKLLNEFNNTSANYPREETLVSLFEKQVKETPENIALVYHDRQLTYRELNEKAKQLADRLSTDGVDKGAILGLMMNKSPELIIGMIGILKAGAAYLPLDPDHPAERNIHIITESKMTSLVCYSGQALPYEKCVKLVDIELNESREGHNQNTAIPGKPDDIAYIIYTSGSTGQPKGVTVKHGAVVNLINSQKRIFSINEQDRILQFSTIIFDASVEQIWLALLSGAALVLPDKEMLSDNTAIDQYISDQKVTHLHATPSFLDSIELNQSNSLVRVVSGGEECKNQTALKYCTKYEFYNEYGPTETTVTSTIKRVTKEDSKISIGKPIDNTTIYILDRQKKLLPVGAKGELYIGGEGLSGGYLYNEALTREKFIDNPYKPGTLIYKTGDLARWLPDGNLEYLGRIDHQVKIRGFRIELGEIEHQLLCHESIREVAVVARERGGDKQLVAYYVSGNEIEALTLKNYLLSRLPEYMIPAHYIHLEVMPLNANGKLDRKALPEPEADTGNYTAPVSGTENTLVKIWAEVLKLEKEHISTTKSFFELGGHSLRATVLVNRIKKELGVVVPLREVFRYQDIRSLGEYIDRQEKIIYKTISKAEEKEYYRLSAAQRRLYFLYEFDRSSLAYNMPYVVKLDGLLDKQRLESAFKQLIDRHESLRTTFEVRDDEPLQKINNTPEFTLAYFEANEESVQQVINDFIRPFDLNKGPLIRVGLIERFAADGDKNEQILMVDMHHIIADGVSQGVLVKDFMSLYSGLSLPKLELQYKDYAEWQQSAEQQHEKARQKAFWLNMFSDEVTNLDLPIDFPRPLISDHKGGLAGFELTREQSRQLMNLAEAKGATMFMVIFSIYNILLSKLGNQEDIVVGTPLAGRQHADVEGMIGMFVNTLPLRNYPKNDLKYDDFLADVKSQSLSGFEHQGYPYEELVDDLKIDRDTSRNPLFDVMFSYQNLEVSSLEMPDLKIESYGSGQQISKFDLSLSAGDNGEQVFLAFEYATQLFKKETIDRFIAYFKEIVTAVIDDSKVKLSDIEILSSIEKHQLISKFNDTEMSYSKEETLVSCFERQVAATPDNMAISYKAKSLSYSQVDDIATRIANYLKSVRGVNAGDFVGIMLEKDEYLIPAIIAILKTGAAYVPIDPAYPDERKETIITDSALKLIISAPAFYHKSLTQIADIINIDDALVDVPAIALEPLDNELRSNSPAYIIYTSGSTGTPKGVMVNHRSVINLINSQKQFFGVSEEDKILMFSPIIFDASVEQMWLALLSGGELVMPDKSIIEDNAVFDAYISDKGVTHLHATPSFLDTIELNKRNSLKRVISGGEECREHIAVKYFEKYDFYNEYGPTETTVTSTINHIVKGGIFRRSIGKPIGNTSIFILDSHQKLVPIGTKGELYIGGDGLAEGYLNREELTKEKFIANPYQPGKLMYRTGDVARWLPDGQIEFLGRIDHQVKIRGFRIELGEIEHQLVTYDEVNESLVVAKERAGDKYLIAYYVSDNEIETSILRGHLLTRLPDYMVPAHYVHLKAMPLNANGKIERKALPDPETDINSHVAPANKTEEALLKIWSEVLKLEKEKISTTSSFFELGGHSLKATVLVNRIRKEMNVEVPLREVFRYQDIRSLAKYIEAQDQNSFISIPQAVQKDYYTLSSAQKRLYILYEFDRRSLAYNMPQVVKLSGRLDRERLQNTFQELIRRHESLRTSFVIVDNEPVQKINVDIDFQMEYFEVSEADVSDTVTAFIRPFDLSSDTLFRAGVIEINSAGPENGQQILMIDLHHIISDGVSQSVLVNDFMALYNGSDLPELKLHYKDFAEWQNSPQQQEEKDKNRTFWLNTFSDEVSPLNLPADYVRPTVKNDKGAFISFELEEEQTQKLKALAKAEGTTMFMIMLAIYKVLLGRLTNQEDIVVGTPVAGRQHGDLEKIIGVFVNTLPLRSYLQKDMNFKSFLSEMESHVLQAIDSQAYPYEELVETLNVRRDTGRNPLFDVMFSYHSIEQSQDEIPGLAFESLGAGNQTSQFDLTLIGAETDNSIVLGFEYATALFKKETIERFVQCFTAIISAVTENAGVNISTIDILPESDKVSLQRFNDTEVAYPANKTVIDYFHEQVYVNGLGKAVICDGEELTYAQLNEKANKLANYLIWNHKVGKEDLIVVYLSRSPEMIVTLLGILKAGAAYLPLDPEYPAERIKTILQEAHPKLIITDLSDQLTKTSTGINVLDIQKTAEGIGEMPGQQPEVKIEVSDAAYVIYTSGSTGLPKGIVLEHESLIDYCLTCKQYFSIDQTDNVVQQASLAFDTSIEEIFVPLVSGAGITIMPSGGRDITYMVEAIKKYQATLLSTTPMVLNELNNYADELVSLRAIISGGDVLLPRQINNLIKKYPLYNTYGPSESSICITYNAVTDLTKTSLIGRPIANREVYIMTEEGALCPILVPGELCVAGKGLAREYLGRPDLTAERFVENTVVGKRVYRTGDLARWLPDGNIEFLGRIDEQVKIRGYRIELGEIETRLTDFNGLNEVAVIARGDEGNRHLVCYYVTEPEKEITDLELRSYLSERLPSYMVPAHFVKLDHLPVTLNGKLNKKALPDPNLPGPENIIAPSDEVERKLVQLWAELLELEPDQIGITHNFFELGGQSLKATRLIYQIRSEFDVQISLVDIFTAPTIVEIAKKIKNSNGRTVNEGQLITLLKKNPETNSNLFFIHDGSGDVQGYIQLARLIDDHNCWGLRCPTLNYYWPLNTSAEELASRYIEMMKTVQAEGPYKIAGWSTGGTLAYEITRQLEDKGEAVETLIMIDTILPVNSNREIADFNIDTEKEIFSDIVIPHNERLQEALSIEDLWKQAYKLLKGSEAGLEEIRKLVPQEIRQLIPNFVSIDIDQLIAYVNTIRTLDNVVLRYAVKGCIKAQLINITARETGHNINLISEYFEKEIIYSEIWGDHFTILQEPQVNTLVDEVKYGLKHAKNAFLEGL